jgi:hypothetical protein
METDWNRLQELARTEIEATLGELPEPLREQARALPVTFEHVPNAGLQADGIEADTLGLFTGHEFADSGMEVLPPQIILFLENLWDFAEGTRGCFATKCIRPSCMSWDIFLDWMRRIWRREGSNRL